MIGRSVFILACYRLPIYAGNIKPNNNKIHTYI